MPSSQEIETIWKVFGNTTSIQGISHYHQREGNGITRRMWLCLALFGIVMTTVHLYYHARNFLRVPITTNVVHKSRDFVFPDVTLCSTSPLVYDLYAKVPGALPEGGGLTRRDAIVAGALFDADGLLNTTNVPTKEEDDMHRRLIYLQMSTGYTVDRGYNLSELIVKCTYRGVKCNNSDFVVLTDPYYYNCYTFRPKERKMASLNGEDGLVLIINTFSLSLRQLLTIRDRENANHYSRFIRKTSTREKHGGAKQPTDYYAKLLSPENEPAGLKLEIHPPETRPRPTQNGFIMSNGRYVEIDVSMLVEKTLNIPRKPCTEGGTHTHFQRFVQENGTSQPERYKKMYDDCVAIVNQRHFKSNCGCYSHFYPVEFPLDGEMCYNYTTFLNSLLLSGATNKSMMRSDDIKSLLQFGERLAKSSNETDDLMYNFLYRLNCHDEIYKQKSQLSELHEVLDCMSTLSCSRDIYRWHWTNAVWPRDFDLEEVVNNVLVPTLYDKTTNRSSRAAPLIVNFTDPYDHNDEWVTTELAIRANLIKLLIAPAELRINTHEEEFSFTVWEALSELGGIIGLWIGMSLLAAFELLEVLAIAAWWLWCRFRSTKFHATQVRTPD